MQSEADQILLLKGKLQGATQKIQELEEQNKKYRKKIKKLKQNYNEALSQVSILEQMNGNEPSKGAESGTRSKPVPELRLNVSKPEQSPSIPKTFGISINKPKKLFGTSYEDLKKRDNSLAENGVPWVVVHCIKYLDEKLDTEGIFRVSGEHPEIALLKEVYESGEKLTTQLPSQMAQCNNPHSVAGLLEEFLTSDPNGLLYPSYSFLAIAGLPELTKREKRYRVEVLSLPNVHQAILKQLLPFILRLREHSEQNKMGAQNLGLVFGPMLLHLSSSIVNPFELKSLMEKRIQLAAEVIAFSVEFFSSSLKISKDLPPLPSVPSRLSGYNSNPILPLANRPPPLRNQPFLDVQ